MCRTILFLSLLLASSQAFSQTEELQKYEVAGEFTTLGRRDFRGAGLEPGVGARFTFNFNEYFSLETAGHFFPSKCFTCEHNGQISSLVGGVKVGKRYERWGIFAKARPGVVSFSQGKFDIVQSGGGGPFPFTFQVDRLSTFAMDVGGVVEFYPSRRVVARFDAGDTLIRFRRQTLHFLSADPVTGDSIIVPFMIGAKTTHNFQFITSIGFRF